MNGVKAYTQEQLDFVSGNRTLPHADLTAAFNKRFGTSKSRDAIHSLCARKEWKTGRTGRFEKGHKPWNIGTKDVCRANSGSFRRGNIPLNHKPVGSERICAKDGYILVKVAEPNVYKHKHRVLWESVYGKIPDGMLLRFRDGNRLNCDMDNLHLVTRQVHCYLNKNGYSSVPADLRPTMLAVAEIQCKVSALTRKKEVCNGV